jgi:hypothetical protein
VPTSFQGIGTTYYGQKDFGADGSFITTEWAIFAGIPIVPLRSLRVRYEGSDTDGFPLIMVQSVEKYSVLAKTTVNCTQALMTYGFMLFMIAWVVFLTMCYTPLSKHVDETVGVIILFIAFVPAALLPVGLRIYAKRHTKPRA